MNRNSLYLIDAYAMIFRAFYAMIRRPHSTTTGIDTSATFGFVNFLQELLRGRRPTHIAVCFDPGGPTFRHEAFPEYKANRDKTPEGILVAVPYIKRILEAYRIPVFAVDGFEADDVIGTLAGMAERHGMDAYMVTGDKDFDQLVTEHIKVFNPKTDEELGVEQVKQKHGISHPAQVIDLLGLMGDHADNIPGCPGVGPKNAQALIAQFGSVEALLEHTDQLKGALKRNVEQNAELIRQSKWLATIRTDVPVEWNEPLMRRRHADLDALRKVFAELEFRSMTRTLIDGGAANVGLEDNHQQDSGHDGNTTETPTHENPQQLSHYVRNEHPDPVKTFEQGPWRTEADTDAAARLAEKWLTKKEVAVCPDIDGDQAMTATLRGIAVAAAGEKTVYLPLDPKGRMLQAIKPLFTSDIRIVAADVKQLIVALSVAGIDFDAPYYDTGVAHYLLQPERTHTIRDIARELLHLDFADTNKYDAQRKMPVPGGLFSEEALEALAGDGRQPEKTCADAELTLALPEPLDKALAKEKLTHLLTDIELPLVRVLARMELAGARIDVNALNAYAVDLSGQVDTLEQECWRLAGQQFNTASPMQVGEILFGKLALDPKAKKTKTGQYKTTEEILVKLRGRHPIVDKILELRGVKKLLTTYVTALPKLINPRTGRLHTTFKQTVTATGRLSSVNPNLQNIPVRTDMGKEIRRAFIPAPGNVFFSADYSQIELRLVADISGDKTMLEAFAEGNDIHAITAAKIYHLDLDQVTPDQRRRAKTANFGILYGITAFGLAERLNIPRGEAKELIDGYFQTFPGVREYIDRAIEQARCKGYVTTLDGRRRKLPDINSQNPVVRSFNERNAVNAPIQGSAADIIKRAMIAIDRRFEQEHLNSKMILQVHDELNFDVVPDELPRVEEIVVAEMEAAYKGRVRMIASHAAAANWLDAH